MKKIFAVILSVLLAASFCTECIAAGGYAEYLVTAPSGAVIYALDSSDSAVLATAPAGTILTATAASKDFVKVSYEGFRGWTPAGLLSAYPPVNEDTDGVKKIVVTNLPDKLEYAEDEEFDPAGLSLAAVFDDGSKMRITGYTVNAPDMFSAGEKQVTVGWNGFTAQFGITVVPAPLEKIVITGYPDKLDYKQGDEFSAAGLVVTAYYTDGSAPREVVNYTVSGFDSSATGKQKLTVDYKGKTAVFTVNVRERFVVSVSVDVPPSRTVYYGTDFRIDLSGLVFTALYDNGTSGVVEPEKAYCRRAVTVGSNTVILEYKGATASYGIEVKPKMSEKIELVLPDKTEYGLGEKEDLSGLIVFVIYNDGSRTAVDEYTVDSSLDTSKLGEYTVTVRYKTYEAKYKVYVNYSAIPGDANRDGRVTASDARLALRFAAGIDAWSEGIDNCDVNSDGDIRADDARLILRFAADLITEFPIKK